MITQMILKISSRKRLKWQMMMTCWCRVMTH